MLILIGTEREIDQLPADLVQRADLILTKHPEDSIDFGNDGFFWECTKDRRGAVGVGTCYLTAASALACVTDDSVARTRG